MYEPTEGRILVDGMDLAEIETDLLQARTYRQAAVPAPGAA